MQDPYAGPLQLALFSFNFSTTLSLSMQLCQYAKAKQTQISPLSAVVQERIFVSDDDSIEDAVDAIYCGELVAAQRLDTSLANNTESLLAWKKYSRMI
jgi:hypothetical protein